MQKLHSCISTEAGAHLGIGLGLCVGLANQLNCASQTLDSFYFYLWRCFWHADECLTTLHAPETGLECSPFEGQQLKRHESPRSFRLRVRLYTCISMHK